jgi:hypothetical protein
MFMRVLLFAAGAVLTLSACGGGGEGEANSANGMAADSNMMATDNMMAGDNMMMDQNAAMNGATMNGNMTVDPATQNMMQQDMNTNAPDTNLANGM